MGGAPSHLKKPKLAGDEVFRPLQKTPSGY